MLSPRSGRCRYGPGTGNADFISTGPIAEARHLFPGKRCHMHNTALTAVRTERRELLALAEHMTRLIPDATGPVSFFIPLRGFSEHDSPRGHLHDPSLPPVFAAHLQSLRPSNLDLREFDFHINDHQFADTIVEQVVKYTKLCNTG
ncbi:Tm-1-like ATP-binding domain-containing protein [Marinobacterium aestuarii]|nr:Tm-1-like ATP-binding domain-containing protein [Marinobacterium aestuarii]